VSSLSRHLRGDPEPAFQGVPEMSALQPSRKTNPFNAQPEPSELFKSDRSKYARMPIQEELAREKELQKSYENIRLPNGVKHNPWND